MDNKNILISGAGIAGTTLAFWLKEFGFNPTMVENSPTLRKGGHAIDFMGAGYDVAEKMGIIPALKAVDINFSKLVFVDSDNREKGSMDYQKIKIFLNGRAFTLFRSDLARVIYQSIDKGVEIIFGDTIAKIEENRKGVAVMFQSGKTRDFDLLVGADGLHSNVRKLVFGNESQFEKYYGYYTSSFTIDNISLGNNAFSMYNVPYKQVGVFSKNENSTTAFFIFASPEKLAYQHHDIARQKKILKSEFESSGWKCRELLSRIDSTTDFYFDCVSQIKMESWYKSRVALVGDAGYCPSLLSGKGSTLAMVGAYILAGELKQANGDYKKAFEQYQLVFKPFMEKKQKSAQQFAKSFVPKSSFGIWLRNKVFKLMSLSIFSKLFLNQFKDSGLKLKEY
ncbi:FAD-dependent monooxygenase [Spirosoma sp. SC4-14]|uniref:FAD-dependent monooxygenase n=1 Tax=Spirosoma sp. SC4-14 TaxID=3128900 RepID=UPI0030CB36CA